MNLKKYSSLFLNSNVYRIISKYFIFFLSFILLCFYLVIILGNDSNSITMPLFVISMLLIVIVCTLIFLCIQSFVPDNQRFLASAFVFLCVFSCFYSTNVDTYTINSLLSAVCLLVSVLFIKYKIIMFSLVASLVGLVVDYHYGFSYYLIFVGCYLLIKQNVDIRIVVSSIFAIIYSLFQIIYRNEFSPANSLFITNRYSTLIILLYVALMIVFLLFESMNKYKLTFLCLELVSLCSVFVFNRYHGYLFASRMLLLFIAEYILYKYKKFGKIFAIENNKEKCIFLFLIFSFIIVLFKEISGLGINDDPFVYYPYYLDYIHDGFIQRGFIGTVFYLLFGYYVPYDKLKVDVSIMSYTCFAILTISLFYIFRETLKKKNYIQTFFLALYILSSAYYSYIYKYLAFRLDIYIMTITVFCIILMMKKRFLFMIPFLCLIGILIHQVFMFMCFPLILVSIVYYGKTMKKKQYLSILLSTLFITGISFIYIQCFSVIHLPITADRALEIINERSDNAFVGIPSYDGNKSVVRGTIFGSAGDHLNSARLYMKDLNSIYYSDFLTFIIHIILLILLYVMVFINCVKKESERLIKVLTALSGLSVSGFILLYFLESDYGRWDMHLIAHMLLSLFILSDKKENVLSIKLGNKKVLFALLVIIAIIVLRMDVFRVYS